MYTWNRAVQWITYHYHWIDAISENYLIYVENKLIFNNDTNSMEFRFDLLKN